MTGEDSLQDTLARHAAFWECAEVDRPLLGTGPYVPWSPPPPYLLRDGSRAGDGLKLEPGMIDLVAALRVSAWQQQRRSSTMRLEMLDTEQALREGRSPNLIDGDFVRCWGPYPFPWTEAILGCSVFHQDGTCWAMHLEEADWRRLPDAGDWRGSPWLEELLAANRWLAETTQGRMGVSQPLSRGPFDMATTAVGAESFCMLAVDSPSELEGFMSYCADLHIGVARRRLGETPPFHGGYFPYAPYALWAPGPTVRYQADNSYLVSPHMYRKHFLRFDQRIAQAFEYSAMGAHTTQARHLPVYAEIPELRMIEVVFEAPPFGRPPLDLLPQFREVQAMGKGLLLTGVVTQAELDGLLDGLSPRGLALWLSVR